MDAFNRVEGGIRLDVGRHNCIVGPAITYVTVVLNSVSTIGRAINSVCNQSCSDFEYIIIDGGSSDGTLDVILDNANKIDYFVSEKDSGIYGAFNKAISLARGSIICIVNADDWLEPDAAMIALDLLKNHSDLTVLFTAAFVRDDLRGSSSVWVPKLVSAGSYFTCANVCHNAMYANRSVYEFVGMYDEIYKIAGDFEWIMRCLDRNVNFVYSDCVTVNYSIGGVSSDKKKHRSECMDVAMRRFPFLKKKDIEDLFFCFFDSFDIYVRKNSCNFSTKRTDLLKYLIDKYAEDNDFVQCMAWASVEKLVHPLDVKFISFKYSLLRNVARVKELLFVLSPRLYKLINKMRYCSLFS